MSVFAGPFAGGGGGGGALLNISSAAVPADTTGVVAQLLSGLSGVLTFSKLSGAAAVTISPAGAVSLSSGLAANASASFVARVQNATGDAAERSFIITGAAAAAALSISGTFPTGLTVGDEVDWAPSVSGGVPPYAFDVSTGELPGGLSLNGSTGEITGTLSASGAFSFTLRVTDDASPQGEATLAISVTVAAAVGIPLVSTSSFSNAVGTVEGTCAIYDGTPPSTVLDVEFPCTYPGFDTNGDPTTWAITNRITRRLRQPGLEALDANKVGLALPVYTGTVIPGVTNLVTSTEAPQPIVNWAMVDRELLGDADFTVAVTVGHGWARAEGQVACVEFRLTDGTTSITSKTSTMVILPGPDAVPVQGYQATFTAAQMAALANGVLTLNVRAFPWVGVSSSVFDSATITNVQNCSPRFFVKDTTRFAARPVCYIDPVAGNNTTGVWSTNPATAKANPFLTFAGATAATPISTIPAGAWLPAGSMDGVEIRLMAGTTQRGWVASGNQTQRCAATIVTRDPDSPRADCILNFDGNFTTRFNNFAAGITAACLRIRDVAILRNVTGTSVINNNGGQLVPQIVDCNFHNGFDTAITNVGADRLDVLWTNFTTAGGLTAAAHLEGLWRGNSSPNYNGKGLRISNFVGNRFPNFGTFVPSTTLGYTNATFAFNEFPRYIQTANSLFAIGGALNAVGVYRSSNLIETINTTSGPAIRVSPDGNTGNLTHIVDEYNTETGWATIGRRNFCYVDASSPLASRDRIHREVWTRANVISQDNSKHDAFGTNDANRIGGWSYVFGCGRGPLVTQFDAAAVDFRLEYVAPGSYYHTAAGRFDPGFVNYQGTVNASTAGAGGGNYTPASGGWLDLNRMPTRYLPFGNNGVARPMTGDVMGAYAA